jgi:probable HAF family extracellular repeat protein
MKSNKSWLVVLAAVAALTSAQTVSAASAQSRYTVTDLGTLPGLGNSYVWGGVNGYGHVAAYATDSTDPNAFAGASSFLWKGPGDIQLLPGLPGADTTVAFGLNDLDQVVGGCGPTPTPQAPQGQYIAVLWEGGNAKALSTLPGDTDSDAFAINNWGLVVGHSLNFNVDPFASLAVYWYKGKISPLPPLDGAANSDAIAVNDLGQAVGVSGPRAVLWSTSPKESVMDLGTLGGDGSTANAINNSGQIVGSAQTVSGDWHPVLWKGTVITDLQNFDRDTAGCAFWINSCGQIVGYSGPDKSGSDLHNTHALLWEDGQVVNLQTQIPNNSGWVLRQATGINDRGQITGIGQHNGKNRTFLLTPVDAQP